MQWFLSLAVWQQALVAACGMYAATALGASLVFFSQKLSRTVLTLLLGSAAGIMIAASFFSLLLPALDYPSKMPVYAVVTLGFLLGGLFLVGSDLLFSERGFPGMGRRNGLMFLAVTMHNIPEGMAVGVAFAAAATAGCGVLSALIFALGIAIQNFPEGACVAFPLKSDGMRAGKAFAFSQASGLVEIPACVLGAAAATFSAGLLPWALSFSAGAMIVVVAAELLPACFEGNKRMATLGLILGFCIMMLLDLALG